MEGLRFYFRHYSFFLTLSNFGKLPIDTEYLSSPLYIEMGDYFLLKIHKVTKIQKISQVFMKISCQVILKRYTYQSLLK